MTEHLAQKARDKYVNEDKTTLDPIERFDHQKRVSNI